MKIKNNVGIISYGTDIPQLRIKIKDIASTWNKDPKAVERSLGVIEKAVPSKDEDTVTLSVNSSQEALNKLKNKPKIGAIYTGSESHPYAVKSTSSIVGEALGIGNNYTAADLEFACKAGTAGVQMITGMVSASMIEYGIAIGADTAQSKPGDALEYAASASGASFIIGSKKEEIIAHILYTESFTSDTPDFWRREHQTYPSHAGRFSGEPAYFKHIIGAVKNTLKNTKSKIEDFNHIVFHMPNASFPKKAAKILGASDKQLQAGFVGPYLGNSYSACSLVGLASVLDQAKPKNKILLCSYGSGSGSDCFIMEVTNNIKKLKKIETVQNKIDNKEYISYTEYLKNMGKLKM
ncbi:MAG: hydroxymethylglutaryl-CoA synthase [Parcubacteria group bacterium]|nr:hydroxymethylglutaryl-CoA synthase [Parcubacteria group bacterium]